MKRALILFVLPLVLFYVPAQAQDSGTAAAIAARQDADERYKRVAADLQAIQSDNETLHAKIASLEREMQALRDNQAKPVDNSAMQGELRQLAEKIQEVDKKRMEDKGAISEEVRKSIHGLETSLSSAAAAEPPRSFKSKAAPAPEPPQAENGFSYTVHEGDTLSAIVNAYNADFKSKGMKPITRKQTREANPAVNWDRLRVGQKVIIPRPSGA
jgi:peptidoglycan hydrolase CwlO-like protein